MKKFLISLAVVATAAYAVLADGFGNPPNQTSTPPSTSVQVAHAVLPQNNYDRDNGELFIHSEILGPGIDNGTYLPTKVYVITEGFYSNPNGTSTPTSSGWKWVNNRRTSPQGFVYYPTKFRTKLTNVRDRNYSGYFTMAVEFNSTSGLQFRKDVNVFLPYGDSFVSNGEISVGWPMAQI